MSVPNCGGCGGGVKESEIGSAASMVGVHSDSQTGVAIVEANPEQAESIAVVIVDEVALSEFVDTDIGVTAASIPTAIRRVDSLTLALEAIQGKQAAAMCLATPNIDSPATARCLSTNVLLRPGKEDSSGESGKADVPQSNKRASSLKISNRQSCETQASKKVVRFADAMGLDLALVRHVFDLDSPPEIPPQATKYLVLPPSDDDSDEDQSSVVTDWEKPSDDLFESSRASSDDQKSSHRLYLSPSFAQPGSAPNFNSRVAAQKVVLEQAYCYLMAPNSSSRFVRGLVRVANLGFVKQVQLRFTFDGWQNSLEVAADYQQPGGICGSEPSDQFSFSVSLPESLRVGDRVTFCIAYSVNGHTYWDNNFGDNYSFYCVAINSAHMPADLEHTWTRYI